MKMLKKRHSYDINLEDLYIWEAFHDGQECFYLQGLNCPYCDEALEAIEANHKNDSK